MKSSMLAKAALLLGALGLAEAYQVEIKDTDNVREVCSGMYGGKDAYIELAFNPSSSGQVAVVMYEWADVKYLGVQAPNQDAGAALPKTYICTSSAVQSNLCDPTDLGSFITSGLPEGKLINETSIFSTGLKFETQTRRKRQFELDPGETIGGGDEPVDGPLDGPLDTPAGQDSRPGSTTGNDDQEASAGDGDELDDVDEAPVEGDEPGTQDPSTDEPVVDEPTQDEPETTSPGSSDSLFVPVYGAPIVKSVPYTGYWCVGVVPVTLVTDKRDVDHAEYSGVVVFRNTFEGALPAVEYPKINFYMFMSIVYAAVGLGWGFLCFKHRSELLQLQYYISGMIAFLVIENLGSFAYYRYINKHGGGTASFIFLIIVSILNAGRNSASFFLLLIVAMGLSVVTPTLGSVMNRIRILTIAHFVFGVIYSLGTVEVQLESASIFVVLLMIFPLALTLTAFLMWIIISLNGTITHLAARKQRHKLKMFKSLYRILMLAVIAVAAFFVISSLSLSNRLDEDYAPRNWKYRWIMLDGSLATIYLLVFAAMAWLWRPSRDNVRFAMSQELAQDEAEADADDYEITDLESGHRHQRLQDDDEDDESKNLVREENVVFQMGDDSDSDDEDHKKNKNGSGYRDEEVDDEAESSESKRLAKREGKDD